MIKKIFFIGLMALMAYGNELVGYYLTHQNDDGKRSIVEIFEHNQKFYVYGIANTDGSLTIDSKNPDPKLKDRVMKGAVFVWDLKADGKEWDGGKIYNYANGKTYDASMWFNDKGELIVKASVWGFGKKMIWTKLSNEEAQKYLDKKPSLESVIQTIPTKE